MTGFSSDPRTWARNLLATDHLIFLWNTLTIRNQTGSQCVSPRGDILRRSNPSPPTSFWFVSLPWVVSFCREWVPSLSRFDYFSGVSWKSVVCISTEISTRSKSSVSVYVCSECWFHFSAVLVAISFWLPSRENCLFAMISLIRSVQIERFHQNYRVKLPKIN